MLGKECFLCKKKLNIFSKYSKIDISQSNKEVPIGMTDEDDICRKCFGSSRETRKRFVSSGEIRKPVSLKWQSIFIFIPILALYAWLRIEKFWLGLGLHFLMYIPSIVIGIVIPFPWSVVVSIGVTSYASIYFVRKWSRQWNESISENS